MVLGRGDALCGVMLGVRVCSVSFLPWIGLIFLLCDVYKGDCLLMTPSDLICTGRAPRPPLPPSLPSLPLSLPSSPDGDEEVLEIAVDVEELMSFASNLEDTLKGVARKKHYTDPSLPAISPSLTPFLLQPGR